MEDLPGNCPLTFKATLDAITMTSKTFSLTLAIAGLLTGVLAGTLSTTAYAAPHTNPLSSTQLDAEVEATLDAIVRGDMHEARVLSRSMASRFPRFALGQLLYAELEANAAFDKLLVSEDSSMSQSLIDLLLEAQARLDRRETQNIQLSLNSTHDALPTDILQIGSHITDLVVVDLADSMLYQYEAVAGVASLVREHYVGSGTAGFGKLVEGDEKTPLGLYRINGFRDDNSLPDLYGSGALMLDYPNALDKHLGRTGSGIWLHGVPSNQHSRAPHSSEGCVTMSNDHLLSLKDRIITTSTDVLLTHSIKWQSGPDTELVDFQQRFLDYVSAWSSGDVAALETIYTATALPDMVRKSLDSASLDRGAEKTATLQVSGQVLSAKHLEHYRELNDVDVTQISIVRIPMIQSGSTPHVVMQGRFGTHNENHVTLYWAQTTTGEWHIVNEKLITSGT